MAQPRKRTAAQVGGPDLDERGISTADVAALADVEPQEAEPAAAPPRVFVNEGMRDEIDQKGFTIDPATGRKVTREDLAGVVRGY